MDIYNYTDYRQFIRDTLNSEANRLAKLSLQSVGQRLELSKSSVKYVLDNKRHIGDAKIEKWARFLKLNYDQRQYFRNLVLFNKAKSHQQKQKYFNVLIGLKRSPIKNKYFDDSNIGYFQKWFYPAIAELSWTKGFVKDPKWVKARLAFDVPYSQITKAIIFLEQQGLLQKDSNESEKLKTDDNICSHIYKQFVVEQCQLAKEALDKQSTNDREFFTLTISVDEEKFALAKQEIAKFRHKIHDLLASESPSNRVIQINMNMFSLTKSQDAENE